jgi:thiamine transport system ATP-binding protein
MLAVEGLTVRYPEAAGPAVDTLDLAVADGEVVAVLGPSGCGKTTLLRVVAGLVPADEGRVVLDGRDLGRVPTHRRGIGLMFQDYALFPHRDVAGNVGFGLRMQGVAAAERDRRVAEVLGLVGLAGYGGRAVSTLSGGERQRVALARALAPAPRLLMLDEPLGALDRTRRDELVVELATLFAELGLSVVYVTHDQSEALALADRVVIMDRGRVARQGRPPDVWDRPGSPFVAGFLGFTNLVPVTVGALVAGAGGGGARRVTAPWGELTVPVTATEPGVPDAGPPVPDAGPAVLLVRADGVRIEPAASVGSAVAGELGPIEGTVRSVVFRGDRSIVRLATADGTVLDADVPATGAAARAGLEIGTSVRVAIDPERSQLLPPSLP